MYLSLTGARIEAQEALRMGIIHKIVPLKDLMSAALEMADPLLGNCPTHLRARTEHLLRGYNLPYDEARAIYSEDIEMSIAMGRHGAALLNDGDKVITHCNSGGLATSGS